MYSYEIWILLLLLINGEGEGWVGVEELVARDGESSRRHCGTEWCHRKKVSSGFFLGKTPTVNQSLNTFYNILDFSPNPQSLLSLFVGIHIHIGRQLVYRYIFRISIQMCLGFNQNFSYFDGMSNMFAFVSILEMVFLNVVYTFCHNCIFCQFIYSHLCS